MNSLVIAGTHSGCGKTTVTLGLLAALKKKGLEVQPFKAGPDFIDTGLHRLITGRPSRNLDLWMCGEKAVFECFKTHTAHADIAVIEGVMGMYDGDFSTADLASILGLPTVLVVDAYGMAESAGAIVRGFASSALLAGVIFNRVASDTHYERLKSSVRDVPVLGYLPRDLDFEMPHRHLGLVVAEEIPIGADRIDKLADTVLSHIDINAVVSLCQQCNEGCVSVANRGVLQTVLGEESVKQSQCLSSQSEFCDCSERAVRTVKTERLSVRDISFITPPHVLKLAVAYDKAFCFYYVDNLDLLREAGAEIVFFSPLSDHQVPADSDALYIGGGYPELYAEALSGNSSMLASVNAWASSGKPVYAECGGLMYLSKGIHDFDDNFFRMAGVFPFKTQMRKGRSHLGYREIMLEKDCILGKKGDRLRGHEFHYSEIVDSALALNRIYSVCDKFGQELPDEGYLFKNTLASYVHLHFAGNRPVAESFITHLKEK